MAKPINPYQGAAPAAMAQMGQGMAEVGANIGRTLQRGYESMGQGIAGGIKAVSDAYKQSKEDEAKFNATKKMYKLFGGSLDETQRKEIDGIFADTSMSVREKNALAPTLMQYLGASQQQNQAMAKQKAELDARAGLQAAGDAAARDRAVLGAQSQFDIEQLRQKYRAQQGSGVNFGLDPFGGGGTGGGAGYYNQQYGE
jgi:hypothetical protein